MRHKRWMLIGAGLIVAACSGPSVGEGSQPQSEPTIVGHSSTTSTNSTVTTTTTSHRHIPPALEDAMANVTPSRGEVFREFGNPGALEAEIFESFQSLIANAGLVVIGTITTAEVNHFSPSENHPPLDIWTVDLTVEVDAVLGGYDAPMFEAGDTLIVVEGRTSQEAVDRLLAADFPSGGGPALLVLREVGEIPPVLALPQGRDVKHNTNTREWLKNRYRIVSSQGSFTMLGDGRAYAPTLELLEEAKGGFEDDHDEIDPVLADARTYRFDQLVGYAIDFWACRASFDMAWTDRALEACEDTTYRS